MARQFYLSRVVGTGTTSDKYRSRAGDLATAAGGNAQDKIPDGAVAGDWCLVAVDVRDHASLLADPDVRDFPDVDLDAPISSVPAAVRQRLTTALQAAGIDTSGLTLNDPLRAVVRLVGRRFAGTAFDEATLVVKAAG